MSFNRAAEELDYSQSSVTGLAVQRRFESCDSGIQFRAHADLLREPALKLTELRAAWCAKPPVRS
jgi:hypothetical protein